MTAQEALLLAQELMIEKAIRYEALAFLPSHRELCSRVSADYREAAHIITLLREPEPQKEKPNE